MRRVALLTVLVLTSCSRTTTDKAEAYYAVFRADVPPGVLVKNASFWENRHLFVFYEYASWLELEIDEEAMKVAMTSLGKSFQPFDATNFGFGSAPPWFAPRDGSHYDGWQSADLTVVVVRSDKTRRVYVERAEL